MASQARRIAVRRRQDPGREGTEIGRVGSGASVLDQDPVDRVQGLTAERPDRSEALGPVGGLLRVGVLDQQLAVAENPVQGRDQVVAKMGDGVGAIVDRGRLGVGLGMGGLLGLRIASILARRRAKSMGLVS